MALLTKNQFKMGRIIAGALTLLTIFFLSLACYSVNGQIAELQTAKEIANIAVNKDFNWLVLFVAAGNTAFSFFLIKILISMFNKSQELALEQLKAIQNITSELEKRPCWRDKK
jgi:hypothetical protein